VPRVCAVVLAGTLLAMLTGPAATAPRAAALTRPGLQVPGGDVVAVATITGVDPAFVDSPDDVVRLAGTVRNLSDDPLVDVLPALRLSLDALEPGDDLDLVEENPLFRYGRVDYDVTSPLGTLAPGAQASFVLEVPLGSLVPGPGVYVVGFDVLATLPGGMRVFVASARTTIPVDTPTGDPVATALLWPLAAQPSLLPSGALVDDRLAAQIAPGGRLETLVRAGTGAPVTWLVDPDLIATVTTMADGYKTAIPPEDGSGAQAAAGFLALLATAVSPGADVRRLPTADPDAGGMLASGLDGTRVHRTLTVEPAQVPESAVLPPRTPVLADLAARGVDEPTLQAYRDAGVGTVLLGPDEVQATADERPDGEQPDGPAPLVGVPGLTVVGTLPLATPGSSTGTSPAIGARQRLLSQTALAAGQQDPSIVLAPALRWEVTGQEAAAVITAWQQAPWVRPVGLDQVPPTSVPVALAEDAPPPEPLDPAVVAGLDQVAADLARLEPLFASPPVSRESLLAAQARAFSAAWAGDPTGAQTYVATLGAGVAGAESRISVVLSPTVTLSSRSGRFPVTVANDSTADVLVGIRFTSQNSSRLRVADIPATLLVAGEKRTVAATALATANGRVVVSAQLVTTTDEPVGTPAATIVDVTNVGAFGWVVVAAGGLLLLFALARSRWRHGSSG
jgi:hypothetical protein